ncbi:MAG: hypothetical protein Q7U60_03415 [Candidatus Methanoperedens sp.]|nr:hypothetical protein [Candidatus Methanoperedens sp.]
MPYTSQPDCQLLHTPIRERPPAQQRRQRYGTSPHPPIADGAPEPWVELVDQTR